MRAEVTFLSRMILRIDENGIVRTSGHAGFAADADRFIEIDDAVRPLEHRRGGTGCDTGRVRALITARHLVRAARLRKDADIDVLHISTRDTERNDVFRFARGGAGMTADTAGMVDDFGPLHAVIAS